jgi:hypothetical protein
LGFVAAGVLCTWLFVGTTARADARAGGTAPVGRWPRRWLLAGLGCGAFGVALLMAHVVGAWLP